MTTVGRTGRDEPGDMSDAGMIVGPGQRNHDISDGCVPSHTSRLDACRAENRSLRAQLELAEAKVQDLHAVAIGAGRAVERLRAQLARQAAVIQAARKWQAAFDGVLYHDERCDVGPCNCGAEDLWYALDDLDALAPVDHEPAAGAPHPEAGTSADVRNASAVEGQATSGFPPASPASTSPRAGG